MRKFTSTVILILLIAAYCLFATGSSESVLNNNVASSLPPLAAQADPVSATAPTDEISRDMAKLTRLYRYIDTNYYQDVDYNAAYEAMATALFKSLDDQYSYYIKAEEKDDYVENALGTYGGLGLYFSKHFLDYQDDSDPSTLYCVVDRVFPNTPCAKAGMRSNDFIIAINDEDVIPLEADECAAKMKGEPGTKVKLTIKRGEQEFDLNLTRELVNVPTLDYTFIEDGSIGYIQITEFTRDTWQKAAEALIDFDDKHIKKIIIDLRSNGGGDIDVTLSIADCFISEGELLKINYKNEEPVIYSARQQMLVDSDVKVVILVNQQSASSSEILTGAMKDNHRATIIGSKTFGKGIMQIVTPFDEGYVSLTNASFTTASGQAIHGVGISPDIEVEDLVMTEEEVASYTEVYNDRVIPTYVDNHPEFTDENIEAFTLDPKYPSIRHEVLRVLVRYEYINRLPGDQQFIIDPSYDKCLKVAVDFLNGAGK